MRKREFEIQMELRAFSELKEDNRQRVDPPEQNEEELMDNCSSFSHLSTELSFVLK